MPMTIIVQKFGGTSVADAAGIGNVARRIVENCDDGRRVCAVVSAPGGTIEDLRRLAVEITPTPSRREMDMILSSGARIGCALAAMAVHRLGRPAVSFTGSQAGIVTDTTHGNAEILKVRSCRVRDALEDGQVALVAGFQGVSTEDEVTTLGRGGSDTSAVALAHALGASACEIYTNAGGVYTADPGIVPSAQRIPELTFDEMVELEAAGADVMAMRAVVLARGHQLPIHVRSTFIRSRGTQIMAGARVPSDRICGIAHSDAGVVMTLSGLGPSREHEELVCDQLVTAGLELEYMVRETDGTLSLILAHQDVATAEGLVSRMPSSVRSVLDMDACRVTVVGMLANRSASILRSVAAALTDIGLPTRWATSSWSSLSFLVPRSHVEEVVGKLHQVLGLGSHATWSRS